MRSRHARARRTRWPDPPTRPARPASSACWRRPPRLGALGPGQRRPGASLERRRGPRDRRRGAGAARGAGEPARDLDALADELTGRLAAAHEPGAGSARHQRDRRHRPHEPRPGALAGRGGRRRPRPPPGLPLPRARPRDRPARRPVPRRRSEHLIALTGAEDALVVNNNAAAVALAVGLAGRGRGVAVSRGELVEIGGGVRIPEIVRRAGARLVEVGTTNRTRVADFEAPLADGRTPGRPPRPPVELPPDRLHRARPIPRSSRELAHGHGAIVIDDLGSGALLDTSAVRPGPRADARRSASPTAPTSSRSAATSWSAGRRPGCVVGRADLVARMRRDPLARAMRPDKVTLAGARRDARALPGRPGDRARSRSGG